MLRYARNMARTLIVRFVTLFVYLVNVPFTQEMLYHGPFKITETLIILLMFTTETLIRNLI